MELMQSARRRDHRRGRAWAATARVLTTLVVTSSVALPLSGCKKPGITDALKLIPDDASMVLTVDLKAARGTGLERRIKSWLRRNEYFRWRLADLAKQSGVDVEKDIDIVVLGVPAQSTTSAPSSGGIVLIGRFDQPRVVTWFKESQGDEQGKVKVTKHRGRMIYTDKADKWSMAFVDKSTIIGGGLPWVRKMIDCSEGKAKHVRTRPEVARLLARLPQERIIGGVGLLPDDLRRKLDTSESPLRTATAVVAHLQYGAQLDVQVAVDNTGDDGAKKQADAVRLLRKQASRSAVVAQAGLTKLLDKVTATPAGKTFTVKVTLTEKELSSLVSGLESMARSMGASRFKKQLGQ